MKMDTLLNFSGGLDSAYVLWRWLSDNPDKTLLVHHCRLMTHQNRYDKESQAVTDILEWLNRQGLSNYKYLETAFDIRSLGARPLDTQVIAFMTGVLFLNPKYRGIKYNLVCTPKDEYERLGEAMLAKQRASFKTVMLQPRLKLHKKHHEQQLEPVFFVKHRHKADYFAEMPAALSTLAWSCRTPKDGDECGKCHTCKQINAARATHGL